MDETALIRLFTDLTGEGDSAGRSVLMYLDVLQPDDSAGPEEVSPNREHAWEPSIATGVNAAPQSPANQPTQA